MYFIKCNEYIKQLQLDFLLYRRILLYCTLCEKQVRLSRGIKHLTFLLNAYDRYMK